MNYSSIVACDSMNGDGIRISLFCSGCTLACPGCFNRDAWNFRYGKLYTEDTEKYILQLLQNEYISGLSILGGNPTDLKNVDTIIALCKNVKHSLPNKNIWLWSGHTLEEILDCERKKPLLQYVDTLIDGRFVEELKDTTLQWRGSKNQRVLHKGVDF